MASNLDVGVGQHATVTNPTGLAGSVTQNPTIPVEAGGSSLKSAYTTVTSSDPLIADIVSGPIASATLTDTVSSLGDGTVTVNALGGAGFGAQITYTVGTNVASALLLAAPGDGYVVGDVLTAEGDIVTVTVATLA